TVTAFAYGGDGRRTDTWWNTNPDHTSFAAHTHLFFNRDGHIQRSWTSRNSDDTNLVFDTTYCYTQVTGTSCPNSSPTNYPAGDLIVWSIDRLTGARSDYSYDAGNRLTKVTNYHGHTYGYGYDANGNRTSVTVDGTTTQTLGFNAGNQITDTGYHFNAAGQQNHSPGNGVLSYNAAGQMTSQSSSSTDSAYTWAGPGMDELLSSKVTGGDTYDYVYGRTDTNGLPVIDSVAKNGTTSYLTNDPDGTPLAMRLAGGQADYYVRDGQGSIVALIDGTGATTGTYTYDPYGNQTAQTGTGTAVDLNPFRYTGGLLDRGTGWLKHGTRWNDTTTGRWTTPDPITHLNDPERANPYQYAGSNPCNNTDPTGRCTESDALEAAVAVSGLTTTSEGAIVVATSELLVAEPGIIALTAIAGLAIGGALLYCALD
ncbi:MAG TPA: RHS repeat-associated core domain-containing protein, partial [Segeticoccus sp.]|uniref:RHS repeat-associated core domain-containing protein n=1 Tax=Segeticoccus sp. TaxID=2706531 RepID=UPI002D7EF864